MEIIPCGEEKYNVKPMLVLLDLMDILKNHLKLKYMKLKTGNINLSTLNPQKKIESIKARQVYRVQNLDEIKGVDLSSLLSCK